MVAASSTTLWKAPCRIALSVRSRNQRFTRLSQDDEGLLARSCGFDRLDGWGGSLDACVTVSDDQVEEMDTGELGLFTAALGLGEPWRVTDAVFAEDTGRLDLHVDYPRGTRFAYSEPGRDRCPVHDTHDKTWRHLDFFQHKAFLHARVPRVRCPEHGVRGGGAAVGAAGIGFHDAVRGTGVDLRQGDADETGRGDRPRARHPGVAHRGALRAHRRCQGHVMIA